MKKQNKKQLKEQKVNTNFDITKFKFLRDLLLVKALRATPEDGKLVDVAQYEDKPEFGEVIKVGYAVADVKVGDIVRFGKYSTEAIRTNGKDYFIVHAEDLSAVL